MVNRTKPFWDIIVLGGGASGSVAAITAARYKAKVLIIEQKDKIGKKILATGNGKCNFTNEDMDLSHFRGNRELLAQIIGQFGKEDTLAFFHGIGILPKCRNGYYYPNSMTAASVAEALTETLKILHVCVKTSEKVLEIQHNNTYGFSVRTQQGIYGCRNLIAAAGLQAAPKLGSDGSAMDLIRNLGHHFTSVVPALCAFLAEGFDFKGVAGVRTEASVSLFVDGEYICGDLGELQLTDYGISGILVFQISRFASMALLEKKNVTVQIDFCPDYSEEALIKELSFRSFRMIGKDKTLQQMLNGIFPWKLITALLKKAKLYSGLQAAKLTQEQISQICSIIKTCEVRLISPRGFDYAQVCAGGVRSEEVDPATLASKIVPGLYFAGEMLDVDGICGGYNLQWAWSSGVIAGKFAAQRE